MKALLIGTALVMLASHSAVAQGGFRTPTTTCTANNNVCMGDCGLRLRNSPDLQACYDSCERRQADCLQTGTYHWRSVPPQTDLRRE